MARFLAALALTRASRIGAFTLYFFEKRVFHNFPFTFDPQLGGKIKRSFKTKSELPKSLQFFVTWRLAARLLRELPALFSLTVPRVEFLPFWGQYSFGDEGRDGHCGFYFYWRP